MSDHPTTTMTMTDRINRAWQLDKHWAEPFEAWMSARGFLAGWNGLYVEVSPYGQKYDPAVIQAAVDEYNLATGGHIVPWHKEPPDHHHRRTNR